jgi:hypothetical protein
MRHGKLRALYSICIPVVAPLCLCCFPPNSHSQDQGQALRQRFLEQAPPYWEEYARRASRLQGSFSSTLVGTLSDYKLASSWEFKINDRCRLMQTSWERSISGKADEPSIELFAANPNYSFALRRRSSSSPWALWQIQKSEKAQAGKLAAQFELEIAAARTFPVRIQQELLADLVRKPEFRVLGCRGSPAGNPAVLEVDFDYAHAPGPNESPVQAGKLVFDTARSWCLSSYEVQVRTNQPKGRGVWKMKILEWGETDGLPVPRTVVRNYDMDFDHGKDVREWKFKYDLNVPERTPPDEDFTLSAFGLTEPEGFGWKKPMPWSLWLILTGGICVVLALGTRWLGKRLGKKSA